MILACLLAVALAAPWLAPHDPLQTDLLRRLQPPGSEYLLGTDHLGRCQLSRLLFGARHTLLASLGASVGALIIGLMMGLAAGLCGPVSRGLLSWVLDVWLAFPGLVLALCLVGVWGASLFSLACGLALAGWAWWGRFNRGLALSAREKGYVKAAVGAGVGPARLVRYYILPQMLPAIMVAASFKTGWMLLAISGLSYLGLGAQPPTPEWGAMLEESRLYMTRAPWLMLAPGAAVTLTVLGFNLVAEGLRDAMAVRKANEVA